MVSFRMAKETAPDHHASKGEVEPKAHTFDVTHAGMSEATGSSSEAFAIQLFKRTAESLWSGSVTDPEALDERLEAAYAALRGIWPRDEAEGMLAAQMVASHNAAMECMRRAMLPNQSFEGRDQNLNHAVKLMGLYERQMSALDKRRGKGKQKITVEHVNVHAGGQAIVGDVNASVADQAAPQPPTLDGDSVASPDDANLQQPREPKRAKARSRTKP